MLTNDKEYEKFSIDRFYKNYLNGPRLFKSRDALEPSYIPEDLPHRDNEIEQIASKTACALRGETPSNFLCYGMTGTGKTATIRFVSQKLANYASDCKPWWIYINCSIVSTPYRILAHIYNTIVKKDEIPPTGLPKDVIFKKLLGLLDNKVDNSICFLVLDEIDMIADKKNGNEILYDLTRLNENLDFCRTCLIGISNKLNFKENLDPRVISSLGEDHITFLTYDAKELGDILNERAKIAFYDDIIKEGVIPLCAALAAKEHGDARKALQLLRKAGEIAERTQNKHITGDHVKKAQDELERDHTIDYIKGMPLQAQVVLMSIYLISRFRQNKLTISGDVYEVHGELTSKIPGLRSLTRRRISDYINELCLAGIITAQKKSVGFHGNTKIIKLVVETKVLEGIFKESDKLRSFLNYKPIMIQNNKVRINKDVFRKLN
ncbi:MAG: AAA family ATPase [Candidatus Lokiarchaeota archaeon]|nr:AAA family ATPase [Candidatus Lokiarchaeota archaeon]MBD3201867.1 AAA family ATPase [Candidatus Lokiarchaeota archaeon]